MSEARLDELRERWYAAVARDQYGEAAKALIELEKLELDEPQWSHRLGEAYRRMGKGKDAEEAFTRAAERYFAKGFFPRAIAMAKLVASLNPARSDLLARIAPAKPEPPPAALSEAPPPPRLPSRRAPPLERAKDESIDEVRFVDSPEASTLDFLLEDLSVSSTVEIIVDDEPQTPPALPIPREPSVDRFATMAGTRLFAGLSRDALVALTDAAQLVEFVVGAKVIVRDEPAFSFFTIVDGSAVVSLRGGQEFQLGPGDVFGESCLLDEVTRQADVRAETPLMTLRVEKAALEEVTKVHAEVEESLFQLLARRLVTNLMHVSPLFTAFEPRVRLELAQMFEIRRASPDTVIAERGRRSDGLYVLLAGNVSAEREGGEPTRVARGTAFGQQSLVGGAPSDITVKAVTESVLLRLPAGKFSSLAALYPPALAHLMETMGEPIPESRVDPK